jgi:nickel/cobalt transporter (NicO) family protein
MQRRGETLSRIQVLLATRLRTRGSARRIVLALCSFASTITRTHEQMNDTVLTTIAITGFGVAFFHAAIPTHWLPFVLASRAQRWSRSRTLAITALAGSGHVVVTAALGFLIAWGGIALNERIGRWFPVIAGGALLLLGAFYLYRQFTGKGHAHHHLFCGHQHVHSGELEHKPDAEDPPAPVNARPGVASDRLALTSLLALLTFSPCEAFLPIYASGVRFGWTGFALLTLILSVGTVAAMVLFTWLTLAGAQKIKLGLLERYESGIIGVLLSAIGLLILLFEHGH